MPRPPIRLESAVEFSITRADDTTSPDCLMAPCGLEHEERQQAAIRGGVELEFPFFLADHYVEWLLYVVGILDTPDQLIK
jgi:hypothetical protein